MKNDQNFKARTKITENIYHQLRNKVTHEIRKSKIRVFDEKINKKLKQPRQFHNALRTHNVVDSKTTMLNSCKIQPNDLNRAFQSNNNAEINEQTILEEVLKINNRPTGDHIKFNFFEVSAQDVIKVVKSIKTNACGVDGISAYFIKISIEYTADILADIINSSFKYNIFPKRWKQAIVKPIPKVTNPTKASDYRPISLLPAFSKILEKIAAKQMSIFLKEHKLLDHLQSAYRSNHSTLTALLDVSDDIYKAIDDAEISLLILLDYSKAFDTANHRLILAKLGAAGFNDDALLWITSYLSDRSQKVRTDSDSSWEVIKNGVPQGSILGPLLFTVLVSDIADAISSGKHHSYADDLQLRIKFKLGEATNAFESANTLLTNIEDYSNKNFLKLNTDKSKYIVIGSKQNMKRLAERSIPPLKMDGEVIERKDNLKNLGVIFDENMLWTKHINSLVSKAYGRLKQAYKFKKFLSFDTRFNLCETYVLSLFNYCDALFLSLTASLSAKIQRVQNSCMRYIFGLRKYDHISECYEKKKTMNMENRRKLHSLILMHKINIGDAPEYRSERIIRHSNFHNYNTRGRENIVVQRVNTTMRSNTFFVSISKLYNEILPLINTNILIKMPVNIFKRKCKLLLIDLQFPPVI